MEEKGLSFLYRTLPGRILLRPLVSRPVSRLCGRFLDSPLSRPLIGRFMKKQQIDPALYLPEEYRCFNDCFCRRIRPELRPIDPDPGRLIAPCDGLLKVIPLQQDTVVAVKQSEFSLKTLLQDEELAARYHGGLCLVFRLCVNHYHRYAYAESGQKGENIFIPGKLHTVRPVALENRPVFTENCREYTVIQTQRLGVLTQMEVGALLVGKIHNYHGASAVTRGEEKGRFLYGGSTVILLIEPGRVVMDPAFSAETETPVQMGSAIGDIL